jgi:hypothetical protein
MPAAVRTQHNDNNRSGTNLDETTLNVENVKAKTFGRVARMQVDGHVYAQPLYVPAVNIPGHNKHDVLYVATMNNSVYAFDANSSPNSGSAFGNAVDLTKPHDIAGGNYTISGSNWHRQHTYDFRRSMRSMSSPFRTNLPCTSCTRSTLAQGTKCSAGPADHCIGIITGQGM